MTAPPGWRRDPDDPTPRPARRRITPRHGPSEFLCPQQDVWFEIHEALVKAWRSAGAPGEAPPDPLVLSGWNYSNDLDKMNVWWQTTQWAERQGFSQLIRPLEPREMLFSVGEPSGYSMGPMGGPCYLDWSYDRKPVPTGETLATSLERLRADWPAIAGPDVAPLTEPAAFTGEKGRRLLVRVVADGIPPWGAWDELADEEAPRRTFTAFRARVNAAISPHMVDHVDFFRAPSR